MLLMMFYFPVVLLLHHKYVHWLESKVWYVLTCTCCRVGRLKECCLDIFLQRFEKEVVETYELENYVGTSGAGGSQ